MRASCSTDSTTSNPKGVDYALHLSSCAPQKSRTKQFIEAIALQRSRRRVCTKRDARRRTIWRPRHVLVRPECDTAGFADTLRLPISSGFCRRTTNLRSRGRRRLNTTSIGTVLLFRRASIPCPSHCQTALQWKTNFSAIEAYFGVVITEIDLSSARDLPADSSLNIRFQGCAAWASATRRKPSTFRCTSYSIDSI